MSIGYTPQLLYILNGFDKKKAKRKLISFRFFPDQITLLYIQHEKYQVMQTDTIYFIHHDKNLSW